MINAHLHLHLHLHLHQTIMASTARKVCNRTIAAPPHAVATMGRCDTLSQRHLHPHLQHAFTLTMVLYISTISCSTPLPGTTPFSPLSSSHVGKVQDKPHSIQLRAPNKHRRVWAWAITELHGRHRQCGYMRTDA
jgi:hypothetical protein